MIQTDQVTVKKKEALSIKKRLKKFLFDDDDETKIEADVIGLEDSWSEEELPTKEDLEFVVDDDFSDEDYKPEEEEEETYIPECEDHDSPMSEEESPISKALKREGMTYDGIKTSCKYCLLSRDGCKCKHNNCRSCEGIKCECNPLAPILKNPPTLNKETRPPPIIQEQQNARDTKKDRNNCSIM
jgi:hypothetical protein